jgi:hypothetical protein
MSDNSAAHTAPAKFQYGLVGIEDLDAAMELETAGERCVRQEAS